MANSYNVDRVYREQLEPLANRIEGRVETGSVDHNRRRRRLIGSNYKIGNASYKNAFTLSPRLGGSYLSYARRSRSTSR